MKARSAPAAQEYHDCFVEVGYFEWVAVFRLLPLQPAIKSVGFAMATWADYATGRNCHPGTENLMTATGYTSRSTIIRATADLRGLRLIYRQTSGSRAGRRGLADMYCLTLTNDARVTAGTEPCTADHSKKPKAARKLSARAAATAGAADPGDA